MEVNFGANATPVVDTTVPEKPSSPSLPTAGGQQFSSPAALAMATVPGVGVPSTDATGGFLAGDTLPGFRDIILPSINIVQSTGELKDSFPIGSIVFGQNLEIFRVPQIDKATGNIKVPGTAPLNLTIIAFRPTRFVEKLSQAARSAGVRGALVNTEAEVRAAGGTLDYNEWRLKEASGMKRFEYLATAFVVIKRPETIADDDTVFTFQVGDAKYALALWNMKGTSYTHAAKKVFFTARRMGCLSKGGYPSWNYSISTRTETTNGNTYYVPVALPCAPSTPEMLDFIKSVIAPPAVEEQPAF
jgi:hypothetical protein